MTGQPADSWGTADRPSAATFMSKGRKQNTTKKQGSGRVTHLKVTHSAAAAAPSSLGQKVSSPAAFHLPLPHPPTLPSTLPASFSPLKEGLIVAMSAVSRAPGTKTLFTPLHILLASVTLSPLTHSLSRSPSPPRLPRIMQSPRLFATPSPPPSLPPSPTPPQPLTPPHPSSSSHLCFGVRARVCACVRACH